ncbi:MAG: hypothetical protein ACOY17_10130 [Pseudomonadota bacterium]|jgi:hypothetical protein|nr:hypothetical protein [Alphaproteobacteria bacterium]
MRILIKLMIATFLIAASGPVSAHYVTGEEIVNGMRKTEAYTADGATYGPYEWTYKYKRSFDGVSLTKHVEINFVFDDTYTAEEQATYKTTAEKDIERIWNNKFVIRDGDKKFPILVDVTTAGPFDQTVNVSKNAGVTDMLNWYATHTNGGNTDLPGVRAHEFGHMLGLFDEYIGGAVDKFPNPTLSDHGLMGSGTYDEKPVMHERYYQQYLDYIRTLNPDTDHSFRLVSAVPEPIAAFLLAAGLLAMALHRMGGRTRSCVPCVPSSGKP